MINPVVGSFGVEQSVKQLCFKALGLGVISILSDKLQLAPRSCNWRKQSYTKRPAVPLWRTAHPRPPAQRMPGG